MPDVWKRECAAGGPGGAAGHPHPTSGLSPLLGVAGQHGADPSGRPSEPRGGPVRVSVRTDCTAESMSVGNEGRLYNVCFIFRLSQTYVKIFMPALPVGI